MNFSNFEDRELRDALAARVRRQVSDPDAGDRLAAYLFEVALTWRPEEISLDSIDTIIAFSFGLRNEDETDPMAVAGPVNEEIAAVVADLANRRPQAKVYAQWEIARVLHGRYGLTRAFSVERVRDANGIIYLSTRGVAEGAIAHAGNVPAALGTVATVGHHDHAWRCVDVCRRLGLDAWVAQGVALPTRYDGQSLQNFTHSADVWQIYDLAIRIGEERQRRIGG